jgi:hypothetical protein
MNPYEGKQKHPGFALQTEEGYWIAYAHGWFTAEDAFYAHIFSSVQEAESNLLDMQRDFMGGLKCCVIVAWEPACGKLRHEVKALKDANKISPDNLMEVWLKLEGIKTDMEEVASLLHIDEFEDGKDT